MKIGVENATLLRWFRASAIAHLLRELLGSKKIRSRWLRASTTARLFRTLGIWTRSSYCYRWLTAEPEPDVIVIDLRDTYTIGPFIGVLDWCIASIAPAYHHSQLRALGRRLETAFFSAPIRALSLGLLVPALVWLALNTISNPDSPRILLPPLALVALALVGTQITRSTDELRANRLVAFLLSALGPPESPSDQSMSPTDTSKTASKPDDDR